MSETAIEQRRSAERRKYEQLAERRPTYGSSNHGRHAASLVLSWRPRFVVDFGCGHNDFVAMLRRRGIDGLGVDFVSQQANVIAPMHAVPLARGIADVVTSFDALEHVLPEDVDRVLAEMKRIGTPGGRFIVSVCCRPSHVTVDGANLHPTVRSLTWWMGRLQRVGTVAKAGRYLTGTWHA